MYDIRDGNTYRIRKLADGNCWMTENLRLTFTTRTTLTPYDSDVSSNWMPGVATQTTTGVAWGTEADTAVNVPSKASVDVVRSYSSTESSNSKDGETQFKGAYYNFYTASAGTGGYDVANYTNVSDTICPRGWSLTYFNGSKSYIDLISTYSITTTRQLMSFPISFIPAGYYHWKAGSISGITTIETWGKRTFNNANAHRLMVNNSDEITANQGGLRTQGRSIRCVAK